MSENMSKIYLEILNSKQQEVLSKIKPVLTDFVLGGGTAIALQIRHRESYDFDFFSPKPIAKNLLEKVSQLGFDSVETVFDSENELTLIIEKEIKVTFLSYPFAKIFEQVFSDQNIRIFSLEGLAAQKAYTVGRRGVWRDYYDIFTLLNNNCFNLDEIIELAIKEYGDIFNSKLFLSQLVYFEDIHDFEVKPIDQGLTVTPSDEVKIFLEKEVKTYLADI